MPFDLDTFKNNIETNGYLGDNRFEVFVAPPPILANRYLNTAGTDSSVNRIVNSLRYRIEQVRVPGVSLVSADINRYGVGQTFKQPFSAQMQDITFSVIVDRNGDIWKFWYNWLREIFGFNGTDEAFSGNSSRLPSFASEYKDNYSTTMQIVVYDQFGTDALTFNIYEAFPSSIREVPLAWNNNGNLVRLAISISFSNYAIVSSSLRNNFDPGLSFGFELDINVNI